MQDREDIQKVTKSTPIIKKKNVFRRIGTRFGDEFSSMPDHLIGDILLPAIEDMLTDMIEFGLHSLLFPDDLDYDSGRRGRRSYGRSSISSHRDYAGISRRDTRRSIGSDRFEVEDIELTSDEAYRVKNALIRRLESYGDVSVAEYYQICGIKDYDPQATKWGWTSLDGLKSRITRDGSYILSLPRTEPV